MTLEEQDSDFELLGTGSSSPKRILIIGSYPLLHLGLVTLINAQRNTIAYDETTSYKQAIPAIKKHAPDLLIIDIKMDSKNGLKLVQQVKAKHSGLPILVFCIHDEPVYEERALRTGADGYITKVTDEIGLLKAIDNLLSGKNHISSALQAHLSDKLLNGISITNDSPIEILSPRELQVFYIIGQGLSTREIAEHLKLSIKTIESHKENIKKKLSLKSSTTLIKRASQWFETSE